MVRIPAFLLVFFPAVAVAQASSFDARGHAVETHRAALQLRMQQVRRAVVDTLDAGAPDLVARLDPAPPPVAQGYQLLPRLVPDAPQPSDTSRRAALYSWPWTDTL